MDSTADIAGDVADVFAGRRLDLLKRAGVDTASVQTTEGESAAAQWRHVSEALMPELHRQAQEAGYSHVLDYLRAGAGDGGKLPATAARTDGSYESPTDRHAAAVKKLEASGLGVTAAQAKVHSQAVSYANEQLASYRKLAARTGDSALKQILASVNSDPIAQYAQASKRVSELAGEAGYSDPRVWVQTMLPDTQSPNASAV